MRPAFEDYIPKTLDGNWSATTVNSFFDRRRNGDLLIFEEPELIHNAYKLIAIILGTIYGACSIALIAPTSDDGNQQLGDEALQVAFSPEVVLNHKIFDWAMSFGSALSGLLGLSEWVGLLLELTTGIKHPQPLDEQTSVGLLGNCRTVVQQGAVDRSHIRDSDVFGLQANGVFVISDFIVRPSTNVNSALPFHVGIGRILNLPVDESGYLRTSQVAIPSWDLTLDPEPDLRLISLNVDRTPTPDLRIDAEPHWMSNPYTICFAIRSLGSQVATLSITLTFEKLMNNTVSCSCDKPGSEVPVAQSERWQVVTVHRLMARNLEMALKCSAFIHDRGRIVIDARGDDVCRSFCGWCSVMPKNVHL